MIRSSLRLSIIGFLAASLFPSFAQAYCGDGVFESEQGEQCDDRNFTDRDGCSSFCQIEDIIPPAVSALSILPKAEGIPTNTATIVVTFSEAVDAATVLPQNISLNHQGLPLKSSLKISGDGHEVTIELQEFLTSEAEHAVNIKAIRDPSGNVMAQEFIQTFKTAAHVDQTPPFVVAEPPAGTYPFAQDVTLIPYLSETEVGPGKRDESVRIYYTLDGSYPTTESSLFSGPFSISTPLKLSFFGVDASGNKSPVFTQVYRFECAERPHAKTMDPYPSCKILACELNFNLQSNTCVPRIKSGGAENYQENAISAPLFSSGTPLVISTKAALQITPAHQGMIRRPIIFKHIKRESELHFERDTKITDSEGNPFSGYLLAPLGRYSKEFPINFGYSFKTILEFKSPDAPKLYFDKPYQVIVPITDRFEADKEVTAFTYNEATEEYKKIFPENVIVDWAEKTVIIKAQETQLFFVAQEGEHFTKAEFTDMEDHWAKNYAEALYRRGIVKGRSKGIYAPDEVLTRAEFTKIALESIGAEVMSVDAVEDSPFPDVALYAWYAPYIKKAKELGLIHGYPDGQFRPEQSINRAEAIKILVSAFGFKLEEVTLFKAEEQFKDLDPGAWYYPSMNFVVQHKFLDGLRLPNGTILNDFGPGRPITRGEMAKLAMKAIELQETAISGKE